MHQKKLFCFHHFVTSLYLLNGASKVFSGLKHVLDCYMNELLFEFLEILQMIMNDDDVQIYLMWEHNLSNEPIS